MVKVYIVENNSSRRLGEGTTVKGEIASTGSAQTEELKEKAQSETFTEDLVENVQEEDSSAPVVSGVSKIEVCGGDGESICGSGSCTAGFFQQRVQVSRLKFMQLFGIVLI